MTQYDDAIEHKFDSGLAVIQNAERFLLTHISSLCEEHDFPYYLAEGSCLGALRHGGMIPWDDDIDIVIPARLHQEFESLIAEHSDSGLSVSCAFCEGGEELCRVFNTKIGVRGGLIPDKEFEHPVIDVLLLCGMPKNCFHRYAHWLSIRALLIAFKFSDPSLIVERKRGFAGELATKIARSLGGVLPFDRNKLLLQLKKAMCRYKLEDSGYAFCLSFYGLKELVPYSWYGRGRRIRFDGIDTYVPLEAEKYLERLYGDWKCMPPEDERTPKHGYEVVFTS